MEDDKKARAKAPAETPTEAEIGQVEAALEAAPADPKRDALLALVREWKFAHLSGGPIARDTACWNALDDAIPALVDHLLKGG